MGDPESANPSYGKMDGTTEKKHGDSRIFKWDKMGQSFMEKRETKTWCCFSIWIRWEFMVMFWYKYSGLTMGQPLKNMDTECVI